MPEKPEIVAGLKNAVERGYPLQQAIQSFINSGYNRQDVLDSANIINASVISKMPATPAEAIKPEAPESINALPHPSTQQPNQQPYQQLKKQPPQLQNKKSNFGWIILLTGLLVILLGVLALFLFAKEQVLEFFVKLGF